MGLLFIVMGLRADVVNSAATNVQTGEGVAIKKVTNVFSKKILAKRALREIKLLQHFRGHRNVCPSPATDNMIVRLTCDPSLDYMPLRYGYPPTGQLQRNISLRGYVATRSMHAVYAMK